MLSLIYDRQCFGLPSLNCSDYLNEPNLMERFIIKHFFAGKFIETISAEMIRKQMINRMDDNRDKFIDAK